MLDKERFSESAVVSFSSQIRRSAASRARAAVRATAAVAGMAVVGCLPYMQGMAPHTVPKGEATGTTTGYFFSTLDAQPDSVLSVGFGAVLDYRVGIGPRSDAGLRLDAPSGIGLSYRYMLLGDGDPQKAALTVSAGGGVSLLGGSHLQASLSGALPQVGILMPYAGAKYLRGFGADSVILLPNPSAAGAFFGARIGKGGQYVMLELGVYRHPGAPGVPARVLYVPSIGVSGFPLPFLVGLGGRR